jgi:peptidoglycan/LPS O-acetylase OafA/YrhL
MRTEAWIRFPVFVGVSYVVFALVLSLVLRRRDRAGLVRHILGIAVVMVVGGMVFAKMGQNAGWPWELYYTVPALLTLFLPPLYFRMSAREVPDYLALSFLSAPFIHLLFSFFLGWKDYMPSVEVPSLWELIG